LEWMFANGGDTARSGTLIVNGTTIGTVGLPPTGDWSTWDTVQQELVALTTGNNSVRLEATTAEGLANINSITVSGMGGITPGECSKVDGIVDCNDTTDQTIVEVTKDGSGSYTTIQAGIDAAKGHTPAIIRIAPGTYNEKIDVGVPMITLCGQSGREADTIITHDDSAASSGSTFNSYTVRFSADDVSAENITFRNNFGDGSQAVALQIKGAKRAQFRNCRVLARQDTLYVHSGSAYFKDCYIEGTVDFIFGGGTTVFDNCEAKCLRNGGVYTAPNTDASVPYGLVFLGGHFTAASGVSGVWLGRPWGSKGQASFVNVKMDGHIEKSGFTDMSGNSPANARFKEYNSTGDGANPSARSGYQMSASEAAKHTISNIYGGSWTPSFSQ
jgi:pectinesterase